jgi:hypothetical protein
MIQIQSTTYRDWHTYTFTTGDLVVTVLPDLGGRIISLQFQGQELLFTQEEHEGEIFNLAAIDDLQHYKKTLGFRLWGGDKTWISPQSAWQAGIPPLDLDAGHYEYRALPNGVKMKSPLCRETGLQVERLVIVQDENTLVVSETVWNRNPHAVQRGIWDVTQLLQPAQVTFAAHRWAIKVYPEEGDSVAMKSRCVQEGGLGVVIACEDAVKFKYGGTPSDGRVITRFLGERQGIVFERHYAVTPGAQYAHDCAVEVYNSADYPYLEVEVHAPFVEIPADEKISNTQVWAFYRE